MEIHHSISQNTLSFHAEKILLFNVDSCPQKKYEKVTYLRPFPICDLPLYRKIGGG